MRWALSLGGLVACGPAVIVGGSGTETDGDTESTSGSGSGSTRGTDTTGPGPATSSSSTVGTTATTSTGPVDTESSTTEDPVPPDVLTPVDCFDDECGPGQWCGPAHNECRPMEETEACLLQPQLSVNEMMGVTTTVAVRVGDVDGDLDDDVIALSDGTPAVTVVLQDVGGFVPLAAQGLALTGPREVDVGDLDGDAIVDLAVSTDTQVFWAAGNGDGTFGEVSELLGIAGAAIGGFGLGRAGIEDAVADMVVYVPGESTLLMGINDGSGGMADVLETVFEFEPSGTFLAMDRGFADAIAFVGSGNGVVWPYVPAEKTLDLEETDSTRITNANVPVVDVDAMRSGGGVHTFGIVNLNGWTWGGYLSSKRGVATTSRMIVGNGGGGFAYALVTEDDRLLVVEDCYDEYDLGGAPVAADAGDLDGDGRGDLAVAVAGVPLLFLLSGG